MRAELQQQEVLAMYDVRGIQSYIFKSNAAKEIIGASTLVEKIVTDGLQAYIAALPQPEQTGYMTDWRQDDATAFLKDKTVQMQVMFVGGGNAYVLFRKGGICEIVNRFLARYILDRTYSLNLAVAVVPKTDSYRADYEAINDRMRTIKASMPLSMPMGALPFMAADSITGYPLTTKQKEGFLSTEARLKREAFPKQEDEKVFDHMVTEKGDSSTLAVVHIDGNSMGSSIRERMQGIEAYENAICLMREISAEIADTFRTVTDQMKAYMDTLSPRVKARTDHKLYREIIAAGDDITFVCNAKLAIPAVEFFLRHIGSYERSGGGAFSACGGIAFFNSHFPFSDAYQVAEACCESAKKRAKQQEHKGEDGKIGNYLDFQICTNISASDLDSYRERHYMAEQKLFIARPYYVPEEKDNALNEKNAAHDISRLHEWQAYIHTMPRSKAKELRNVIPMGEHELLKELSFLKSRGYLQFEDLKEYGIWYDALEIMDWYIQEEAK